MGSAKPEDGWFEHVLVLELCLAQVFFQALLCEVFVYAYGFIVAGVDLQTRM